MTLRRASRLPQRGRSVELRPATLADADLLFRWRNLPEIVAVGTSGRRVERAEASPKFTNRPARRTPARDRKFDRAAHTSSDERMAALLAQEARIGESTLQSVIFPLESIDKRACINGENVKSGGIVVP